MTQGKMLLDGLVRSLALEDVLAADGMPSRDQLRHVLALDHPLGAAVLADRRRVATCGDVATYPVTLRVHTVSDTSPPATDREPTRPVAAGKVSDTLPPASPLDVVHDRADVAGVAASEWQWVGAAPTSGDALVALVRTARAARPDLPVRAFTTDAVLAAATRDGVPVADLVRRLADAGLATFDWAPGSDADPASLDVHRAAHAAGLRTAIALPYARDALDDGLLDRIAAIAALAAETGGVATVVPLPDRTEHASPLDGTAGTEDVTVFALARIALGHVVPHVTLDTHVLGHKLGGLLLSAGVCDVVGAQARAAWPAPSNDAPRPLNEDRVRRLLDEARRTAARRDAALP